MISTFPSRGMPMSPDDFSVTLRIRHPSIDPSELSRRLGLEPQHAWRAGDRRRGDDGEPRDGTYRETYWVGLLPPGPPFGPLFGRRGPLAVGIAESFAHPQPTMLFSLLRMKRDAAFWRELVAQGGTIECQLRVQKAGRFDLELSHALLVALVELRITLSVEVDPALRAAA
jgi:hypothetical protein